MQVSMDVLAKKYAVALLNLYIDELDDICLKKIFLLNNFLKKNKLFYLYLGVPSISYLVKLKALNRIAHELDLCRPITKIMFVLLDHGRIDFLDKVLNHIVFCYKNVKNIQSFDVTTSTPISDIEKNKVIKFLVDKTKSKVDVDFGIDKKLICGMRIQSKSFLWERSISKHLKDIKRSIFKQVGL